MTGNQGRIFDEFSKLMTDAAGLAQSATREVSGAFRSQAERFASEIDLAKREDIEIVRDLAAKALAEVERLSVRVAALEAKLQQSQASAGDNGVNEPLISSE